MTRTTATSKPIGSPPAPLNPAPGDLTVRETVEGWSLDVWSEEGYWESIGVYADFDTADEIRRIAVSQPAERDQGAGKSPKAPSRALLLSGIDRPEGINDRGRPEDDGKPVHPHPPVSDLQALMEAPPGAEPAPSVETLHGDPDGRYAAVLGDLTDRQAQVLALRMEGLGYELIGRRLGISPRTVRTTLDKVQARFLKAGVL